MRDRYQYQLLCFVVIFSFSCKVHAFVFIGNTAAFSSSRNQQIWFDQSTASSRESRYSVRMTKDCIVWNTLNDDEPFWAGVETRRRKVLSSAIIAAIGMSGVPFGEGGVAYAYAPDSDKLRESLYLMSRVQEATVQQERFLVSQTQLTQGQLKEKMTTALKLVERSYRLLDQVNYSSNFIEPADQVMEAVDAGNMAVQSLQSAMDFVKYDLASQTDKGDDPLLTKDQRESLIDALRTTRTSLFQFMSYLPTQKLEQARIRVEEENIQNRADAEAAGVDPDSAVFRPVQLPWK